MKNINQNQIQQGDVTLTKIDHLPENGKTISRKRCVLAEGEVTGHFHVVEDDEAELIQMGEKMLLKLEKQAILTHNEHKPITLDAGIYEVGRINEYDYFSKMVRKVVD